MAVCSPFSVSTRGQTLIDASLVNVINVSLNEESEETDNCPFSVVSFSFF